MSIVEKAIDKHLRSKHPAGEAQPKGVRYARPTTGIPVVDDSQAGEIPPTVPLRDGEQNEHAGERGLRIKLDYDALREVGVLPPESLSNVIGDEFRRIKRPLLANAFGKGVAEVENGNLIMLASALSGEGKTFTAFNLAMSVARERERTVLLIDADVAKPHISRLLGLESRPGLLDLVLNEDMDLGDVLVSTDVPGLRVLPAGQRHSHATELLASDKMEALVTEIANRYPDRVVIFDSPPLLQTAEAQVLSLLVGQIVMVVAAGSTKQAAVETALEMLDPTKAINLVLNKSAYAPTADYYGGYYGYQT